MHADGEGFLYPYVDISVCIGCGICNKICHELHPFDAKNPLYVVACCNRDYQIKMHSSSGGVFTAMCQQVIKRGG